MVYLRTEAMLGCIFCRRFEVCAIKTGVKDNWQKDVVDTETRNFAAWMFTHTGITSRLALPAQLLQ